MFKPTGHVVLSFPTAAHAQAAAHQLQTIGLPDEVVHAYTDQEMLRQIDHDRQHASALASIGQEMNLVLAHRALAARGYHWLLVRAGDDTLARRSPVQGSQVLVARARSRRVRTWAWLRSAPSCWRSISARTSLGRSAFSSALR